MGFWQNLFGWNGLDQQDGTGSGLAARPADGPGVQYAMFQPSVEYLGGVEWAEAVEEIRAGVRGMSPAALWRSQPSLRTVVGFVARNIAQLGLPVYDRVSETDRIRNRDNDFSRALADPGDGMTRYRLIFALVGDKMLYDRAYWLPWRDGKGKPRIRRLPPAWVSQGQKDAFGIPSTYIVRGKDGQTEIPAERLIVFDGYSPTSISGCSPALETLKDTLAEQMEASLYRKQVWKRGGRTSAVIKRPADAPPWDAAAAERFKEDWYSNFTGDGPKAGGTPLLEDGMTIERIDFSPKDMQWGDGQKLAVVTVAGVYYVNPTMIGVLDNANFSNVREFRKMLYGDTLGPYISDLEDGLNLFALNAFGLDTDASYAEFNIFEKLQGSFEEQASVISTSVGGPYMTRNEGRARINLPAIDGGDELITPLNVTAGGQASPTDSGTQNEDPLAEDPGQQTRSGPIKVKARADQKDEAEVAATVLAFFKRQEKVLRSRLGSKAADDWWDAARWDKELAADLYAAAVKVSTAVAQKTLAGIGFSPDAYDVDRTLAWLQEVADRSATSLNAATKAMIEDALSADDVPAQLDSAFSSQTARATMIAVSTSTLVSGFAATESAKQAVGEDKATKTWITGSNPRAEHAEVDGETVLLSENFSNGAAWPGDGSALGAEDLSNCNCELEINVVGGES